MIAAHSGRERAVTDAFVALADTLVTEYDVIELLHDLVVTCAQLLDADAAGILLADDHGDPQVVAYTSEQVRILTLDELAVGHGPGLDCYHTGAPLSVADLTATGPAARWSRYAARAAQLGFRAAHAVPMRLRGQLIGALTLFGAGPAAMTAADLSLCQALADVATIGILQERAITAGEILNGQLQTALTSRIIIEQAKGMLIERTGLSPDEAFNQLRRHARTNNLKLTTLARDVLAGKATLGPPGRDRASRSPS